jgi:hypothetical protein
MKKSTKQNIETCENRTKAKERVNKLYSTPAHSKKDKSVARIPHKNQENIVLGKVAK